MVNNGKLILIIEVTKKNCSFTLLLQYTYTKKKTCIILIEEYRMEKILIMELKWLERNWLIKSWNTRILVNYGKLCYPIIIYKTTSILNNTL